MFLRLALASALSAVTVVSARPSSADPSELPPEVGWNYGVIETPRAAAMSGALRAWGNSVTGLFLNPANMTLTRVYHIGALAQIWPEANRQSYGGAAVDSIVSSTRLAGGVGGTWTKQDPDGIDRTATDVRFALALPIGERFHVGIGGRYLLLSQDGTGVFGPSVVSGGLRNSRIVKGLTFDAGATFQLGDHLAIGVVGNNLSDPGHGFQPMSFGGGVGFGNADLTAEADLVADFTTWGATKTRSMAGFEYLAANTYPLRVGYRYDDGAKSHAVSGGLGYVDQEFSAEIAVRRVVSGDIATTVVIGFKFHLEATGVVGPASGF